TLMLECFGSGTVGDPVLLELVKMLDALQHHDHRGQAAGHPDRAMYRGYHRKRGSDRDLQQLEQLVAALVGTTLAVIPANLVLEPLPCRVRVSWSRHRLDPRRGA